MKYSNTMVTKAATGTEWAAAKPYWEMKSASVENFRLRKHIGPTQADYTAPQITTVCGTFTLELGSPLGQTWGILFPNKMQNLIQSKNRTSDQ